MATRSNEPPAQPAGAQQSQRLLTPLELIGRWRNSITAATLSTWRSRKLGPSYVKVGGRVLYPLHAVEAWEKKRTMLPAILALLAVV